MSTVRRWPSSADWKTAHGVVGLATILVKSGLKTLNAGIRSKSPLLELLDVRAVAAMLPIRSNRRG